MKLIVGLGNPGRKYVDTRHNIGFEVVSKVAALTSASPCKARFDGEIAEAVVDGEKLVLLWPMTYMNASGKSIRKASDFYKLAEPDILVACDDLDLPVGRIRLKRDGSAGGQKGIADAIRHLPSDQFGRLKVGIGRPPAGWDTADYVLGKFASDQRETIDQASTIAAKAAIDWAGIGITLAMNRYNSFGKTARETK